MGEQGEVDFFGCLCQFVWVVFGSSLQFCCFLLVSVSSFWYLPGWASKFGSSTLEKTCSTDAIWGRTHLKDFELEANWQSRTRDLIYNWTRRSIIKQDANFSISVRSLWLLCLLFPFSEASTTLALGHKIQQTTTRWWATLGSIGVLQCSSFCAGACRIYMHQHRMNSNYFFRLFLAVERQIQHPTGARWLAWSLSMSLCPCLKEQTSR